MDSLIIVLIVFVLILIILFYILRELNNWYWKINERLTEMYKTNFLLEKISFQLGASNLDEIIVEEVATGKRIKLKLDKWIEFKMKNPNSNKYKTIKDESVSDKIKNESLKI